MAKVQVEVEKQVTQKAYVRADVDCYTLQSIITHHHNGLIDVVVPLPENTLHDIADVNALVEYLQKVQAVYHGTAVELHQ